MKDLYPPHLVDPNELSYLYIKSYFPEKDVFVIKRGDNDSLSVIDVVVLVYTILNVSTRNNLGVSESKTSLRRLFWSLLN